MQQSQKAYVWPARHYASSLTGAQYPPMGARFRLKASFNISGFSPANQVILTALKQYGMMLADNGANWFISGAPDEGWNNDDLHALTTITGSNFEAVDATVLMVNPDSGQAMQSGVTVNVIPSSANVPVGTKKQFTATVTGNSDQSCGLGRERIVTRERNSRFHRLNYGDLYRPVDGAIASDGDGTRHQQRGDAPPSVAPR